MALLEAHTAYGTVVGQPTSYQASSIFKGIPFAKPPVGPLRWRAPEKPESWSEPKECFSYSAIPLQKRPDEGTFYRREFYPIALPQSEDCLYLNVITPAEGADERLPVALWVYGGAFVQGYANKLETDGEAFAQRGIVYVSFNYRVGPFGFLSAPDAGTGDAAIQDNCGLLDQIAALAWVRENITAFGGDPDRITVFGQSAGAMSVYNLLCSPLSRASISGAIMESGGGPGPDGANPESTARTRAYSQRFIDHLGGIETARALPGKDLLDAWLAFAAANPTTSLALTPVCDGVALPNDMRACFQSGSFADVPCIIGTMRDEDKSNGMPGTALRDGFLCGTLALAERQSESERAPIFTYRMTNVPPGDEEYGAFHSSEHMYIFQTFLRSWRDYTGEDFELSKKMCAYWTNFIKTGDPNAEGLPEWRPYTCEEHRNMRFDRALPDGCCMEEQPDYADRAYAMAREVLG